MTALSDDSDNKKGVPSCSSGAACSRPMSPGGLWERDAYGATAVYETIDRSLNAIAAKYTAGLSPRALVSAYMDWLAGLTFSPGRQAQLRDKAFRKWLRFVQYALQALQHSPGAEAPDCCIEPLPQDKRFRGEAWQQLPFNLMYQGFLLTQQWWYNAATGVRGVTPQNERAIDFAGRQILDLFSPSNFLWTNPEVLKATFEQGGLNLYRGWQNFQEDMERLLSGKRPVGAENFLPGQDVAVTPGKVIYQNRLIELIQYEAQTDKVRPEPILIVPAWIMKYYILDLSPENSLVSYLVQQGYTVFMISWKNPGPEDRDLSLDDYRTLGVMAALDAIEHICPDQKIHATGYCLGGTLLSIAAAAMARDRDERLKSLSFFATQIDFEEAGELMLFINEKQLAFLEDMMWEQGFLDTRQMAGAFQLLRSNDLIWSRMVRDYLMGERQPMTDLMAWNADQTRMPYRMHTEYLHKLFLNNDLTAGRYEVEGKPVVIADIRAPMFVVGTRTDHVAPWKSVYKFTLFADTDVSFLLTSGGHNAGIISEPGHPRRQYQISLHRDRDPYVDPDRWVEQTPVKDGSWWPEWVKWLDSQSGPLIKAPEIGGDKGRAAVVRDAPGCYVLMP
ncbi:PHA/PHB synthase family protein [Luteithermobacter gelatinilyticus]|uniref:PHA/PHB synthase family protein n=1 Tax=Luteithermobacter gelatinilyticus TaxID=2582913 RepID=UPI00110614D1|nr:alpha/beta fold hydrolase [Luteithermobacter gelatinilyticus]